MRVLKNLAQNLLMRSFPLARDDISLEVLVATLIDITETNQKAMEEVSKALTAFSKKPTVVEAPKITVEKLDLKPLEKALAKKQPVTILKADPPEWEFEVERDMSGFIRKVEAKPKKKVIN